MKGIPPALWGLKWSYLHTYIGPPPKKKIKRVSMGDIEYKGGVEAVCSCSGTKSKHNRLGKA